MRGQPYSQRKEDVSCAGFIQPPERVYYIHPPSNPRLDGQRIYTDFAKYACFFHRPALGWTVTDNTFPGLNTHWKCRRSLPLLACQLVSLVHSIQVTISRKDIGEPSLDWLLPSQESSTSWVKKCLRLWLTNCSSLPLILLSRMRKVYGITFLKLWENRSLWYRIPKTFAIFAVDN